MKNLFKYLYDSRTQIVQWKIYYEGTITNNQDSKPWLFLTMSLFFFFFFWEWLTMSLEQALSKHSVWLIWLLEQVLNTLKLNFRNFGSCHVTYDSKLSTILRTYLFSHTISQLTNLYECKWSTKSDESI